MSLNSNPLDQILVYLIDKLMDNMQLRKILSALSELHRNTPSPTCVRITKDTKLLLHHEPSAVAC